MKGSATALTGIAVITLTSTSESELAVNTPRSMRLLMMVPIIPMLSASARSIPH